MTEKNENIYLFIIKRHTIETEQNKTSAQLPVRLKESAQILN